MPRCAAKSGGSSPGTVKPITLLLSQLDSGNHALAVVIANAPEAIRGYEDIKLQRLTETKELVAQHLGRFAPTRDAEAVGSPQTP